MGIKQRRPETASLAVGEVEDFLATIHLESHIIDTTKMSIFEDQKVSFQFPRMYSPRDRIFTIAIVCILGVFVPLAIWNLFHLQNLIPSILWLGFVIYALSDSVKSRAARRKLILHCLRALSRKELLECSQTELVHGFGLFGRLFVIDKLPLGSIDSFYWSAGQASALAMRDMKDWQIWVFVANDPQIARTRHKFDTNQVMRCVGPARARGETEPLADEFAEFLKANRMPFSKLENENSYVRSDRFPTEAGTSP
jgi:hypothetical protein